MNVVGKTLKRYKRKDMYDELSKEIIVPPVASSQGDDFRHILDTNYWTRYKVRQGFHNCCPQILLQHSPEMYQ
jgi:hypothetical protein